MGDARITQAGDEVEADTSTASFQFRVTQAGGETEADTDLTPFQFRVTQVGNELLHDTVSGRRAFATWR